MADSHDGLAARQRILVVDDDPLIRNLVANYFKNNDGYEVDQHEDGEGAYQSITQKAYDFIVLDWKLPSLSGLALFNRIRKMPSYRSVPILVISGVLKKSDFKLLQEFPCTGLLEKPFSRPLFQVKVEELSKEGEWYGQNAAMIETLFEAVGHDGKKAESLLRQLLKKAPNPIPLVILAARDLIRLGLCDLAVRILESILKIDSESIVALNELGKALHFMGRHKQALERLRIANRFSSENIQRLCLMGEIELNLQDPESAKTYFEKALALDRGENTAKAGLVVAENMQEWMQETSATGPRNFASLLNTVGISLVRTGQFARGIEQYQAAMAFLYLRQDLARVSFNLGLAHLRWKKPEEALVWFKRSTEFGGGDYGRPGQYVRQLLAATENEAVKSQSRGPELVHEDRVMRSEVSEYVPEPSAAKDVPDNVIPFPGLKENGEGSFETVETATEPSSEDLGVSVISAEKEDTEEDEEDHIHEESVPLAL